MLPTHERVIIDNTYAWKTLVSSTATANNNGEYTRYMGLGRLRHTKISTSNSIFLDMLTQCAAAMASQPDRSLFSRPTRSRPLLSFSFGDLEG